MTVPIKQHNLYCRQKVARSGSSFYYSFLFLSPLQRQAIEAVYAFCREVDDIVDECLERSIAQTKLNWWHTEIDRIFRSEPQHPIGHALYEAHQHYTFNPQHFHEIIAGMEMDLQYQGYQTFEDLHVYCHRVASCVGLLAAEIFGYRNTQTLKYAENLGIALQLINIIRDVGEDAGRGRIYLPENELAQFMVNPQDILSKRYTEAFAALMQHQANRARQYYQTAREALPDCDTLSQKSGLIMAEIYFKLLDEIEQTDFKILTHRISLTPIRKLWIAWKTLRSLKRKARTAGETRPNTQDLPSP